VGDLDQLPVAVEGIGVVVGEGEARAWGKLG